MIERLRCHGNVGPRLPRPASRRAHFVSHPYIVPHATDKTRWAALRRTARLPHEAAILSSSLVRAPYLESGGS
jgi:hypothetical protein